MSPELLHVEDQLCYVSVGQTRVEMWVNMNVYLFNVCVYTGTFSDVLVYEVVCAFLLDIVGVSKQPDDLISGE